MVVDVRDGERRDHQKDGERRDHRNDGHRHQKRPDVVVYATTKTKISYAPSAVCDFMRPKMRQRPRSGGKTIKTIYCGMRRLARFLKINGCLFLVYQTTGITRPVSAPRVPTIESGNMSNYHKKYRRGRIYTGNPND